MSVKRTATVFCLRAAPSRKIWMATAGRSVPPTGTAPNWFPWDSATKAGTAAFRKHRPKSLPTVLLHRTPRALLKLSGFWTLRGTAAIMPPLQVKGTPVAAAALQTWATSLM